jgi:hypothetical protein
VANHNFAEYARSSAFHINLTSWAITELLIFAGYEKKSEETKSRNTGLSMTLKSSANYLQRRGLIERCPIETYGDHWVLTDAGRHVAALLAIAGFTN